jgi:AcrR family transcriptional regulator
MARPKNADSQDTWNRIIAATRQELTNGAAGSLDVSMRQVALTSGVSLGTIHYYFATKESLLEACLDAYYIALRELAVEFAADLSQGTRENARQLLSESVRRLYRFALSERARLRLLALTNTQRGHYHPFRMAHEREPYLAWFSTILTRLVDIDEAEVRATFTTMNHVIMQYVLCGDDDLVMVVGVGGDEGRRRIEDHVVRVALRLTLND